MNEFKELSEQEYEALTYEQKQEYMRKWMDHRTKALEDKLQPALDAINEKLSKGAKPEEVKAEKEELETKMNNMIADLKILSLKVHGISDTSGKGGKPADSIKAALVAKSDLIKKMKSEKSSGSFTIEVDITKATQGAGDIDSGTDFAMMMPGIGRIPHRRTYIKDRIRIIPTNTEYIKYLDQETVVRNAKNVAACGTTTHNTKLTWKVRTVQQQKVRDFVHICLDMMDDYDFVQGEIRNLLDTSLQLKIDNDLLLADGIAPNPNSIDAVASTFSASASGANYFGTVQSAQLIDLITVCAAQISAFGAENSWRADTVYLNPRDYTLMKLLKDQEDNYIRGNTNWPRLVGMSNGNLLLDGIIEIIANPNVPANEFYIFDSTRAAIVQSKTVVIEFSYENRDNFETETVTAKGYERLNLWIRNVDANAFMRVDDIEAALVSITKT